MPNETNNNKNSGALNLEELLALLKNEHGEDALTSDKKKQPPKSEEDSSLDGFEFDDTPIEADYLNYNRIGIGVSGQDGRTKEEDQDPVEVVDDLVEVVDDLVEVVDDPVAVVDDPVEVVDDPVEVVDDLVEVVDDPVEVVDDPVEVVDDPVEVVDDPVKVVDDPVEAVDDPVEVVNDSKEEVTILPWGETILEEALDEEILDEEILDEEILDEEILDEEAFVEDLPDAIPLWRDEDDDGIPIYDESEGLGLSGRSFHRPPKPRQKGMTTPVDDFSRLSDEEKHAVLPSERRAKEFTAYAQNDDVKRTYRKRITIEWKLFFALLGLTLAAFVIENLDLVGITLLTPNRSPHLSVTLSLVFMIAAAGLIFREIVNGLLILFTGKMIPESLLPIALLLPIISYILSLATGHTPIMLFGFSFLLLALLIKLQSLMRLLREAKTFRVVSTEKPKRVLVTLTKEESTAEREAFSPYVSPGAAYYTVKRTLFVNDYFKMTNAVPKSKVAVALYPALSLAAAALVFALAFSSRDLVTSLSYAFMSFYYTLPFSAAVFYEMPLVWASFSAADKDAAIIGETASEHLSEEGVVSFADSDLFSSNDIFLTNILLFKETAVEKLLEYTALIYDEINSPVAAVIKRTVPQYRFDDPISILSVCDGGLDAMIRNDRVRIGSIAYMTESQIEMPAGFVYSDSDSVQLFVAINGETVGKLEFEYSVDRDTKGAFDYLEKAGYYIALRTLDPNITHDMLDQILRYDISPIHIVKTVDDNERLRMRRQATGPIVSIARTKSLIYALVLSEKSTFTQKLGLVLSFISLLTGALVMLLSVSLSSDILLSGLAVAVFQLFWLLPTFLLTVGYVRNKKGKRKKKHK